LHLLDDLSVMTLIQREIATSGSRVEGRDPDELLAALKPRYGPERMLDFMLRSGPYGDGFGEQDGLNLAFQEEHPHGVDLGPLQPRVPEILRTPSGKIELAPQPIMMDVERLRIALERGSSERDDGHMLLIGRRDLRSNNSWMHNLHVLTKGKERCTLHIHPNDAARLELADGEIACITSRVGSVEIPIEVTGAIMAGVISIPHGWGHNLPGTNMHIATEHAGVNTNILTNEGGVDPLSGNAILNGVAVTVAKSQSTSRSHSS
jgi:anaerobic selenocysteine-containing dehydrogenase